MPFGIEFSPWLYGALLAVAVAVGLGLPCCGAWGRVWAAASRPSQARLAALAGGLFERSHPSGTGAAGCNPSGGLPEQQCPA